MKIEEARSDITRPVPLLVKVSKLKLSNACHSGINYVVQRTECFLLSFPDRGPGNQLTTATAVATTE